MSERNLDDYITRYLQYTEQSEPPTSYHLWCALSLLAAALQRRVYLRMGFETIYPNLYIVLVGPAGRARKGVALGIAKDLLKKVPGISIAPESTSGREAIIQALKRSRANHELDDGAVRYHCSLTAISEELSVFLGQGDIKLLANLTNWYDCQDDWAYETIGRGLDSLQGLCFNFLGGTAPDWIQSMLPSEAVGGGFTSRVIFIVEENKGKTVPEHNLTKEEDALAEFLTQDLERIAQMKGAFTRTSHAIELYNSWYTGEDVKMKKGILPVNDPRFSAYADRRTTHLRKLMMLYSVSRGDSMIINEVDFSRALQCLENAEVKMGKTFGGLGRARYGDATQKIEEFIRQMRSTTRSLLLAKFRLDIDSQALAVIEQTLEQRKVISVKLLTQSGDKIYNWIGEDRSKLEH